MRMGSVQDFSIKTGGSAGPQVQIPSLSFSLKISDEREKRAAKICATFLWEHYREVDGRTFLPRAFINADAAISQMWKPFKTDDKQSLEFEWQKTW